MILKPQPTHTRVRARSTATPPPRRYANLYVLNKMREARGFNTFTLRPHAGGRPGRAAAWSAHCSGPVGVAGWAAAAECARCRVLACKGAGHCWAWHWQ